MVSNPVSSIELRNINFFKRGKVREVYDLGDNLLIISTDRISCFDVILPTPIPEKGRLLTEISKFWFELTEDIVGNHLISTDVNDYPRELAQYKDILTGRSMLVKKAKPLPVECIVRGYISGSGWKDYKNTGAICGINLPHDLKESDRLPEVIFTPSTKAEVGHDENVSQDYIEQKIGKETTDKIKTFSIAVYTKARDYAEKRGIIIADTKFEFGMIDNKIILIDEVLTPDSSRFWPKDKYMPGRSQPSFDKQFVRDYLETIDWGKTPPGPELPLEIVQKTTKKYQQAADILIKN